MEVLRRCVEVVMHRCRCTAGGAHVLIMRGRVQSEVPRHSVVTEVQQRQR